MRILLVVCFAVIAGLVFYVFDLRSELATVRASVQAAQDGLREAEAEAEPLKRNVKRLTAELDHEREAAKKLAADLSTRPKSAPDAKGEPPMDAKGFLGEFGKLLDSPQAKTSMRREGWPRPGSNSPT